MGVSAIRRCHTACCFAPPVPHRGCSQGLPRAHLVQACEILVTPGFQQCSGPASPSVPGQPIHTHNASVLIVWLGGVLVRPALPGGAPTVPAQPVGVLALQPVDHALSSVCRPCSGRTLAPSAVPPSSHAIPPPPSHGSFTCRLTTAWIDILPR